jgi:ribose transport system ATP-binding protein
MAEAERSLSSTTTENPNEVRPVAEMLENSPETGRVPLISALGVTKNFGGVQALKGVNIDIYPGEIHGLVGANGAGKSTLIRILAGIEQPDAGQILLDGRPVEIPDPLVSSSLGLSFIHQELNLVPKFNAIQNMTLGLRKSAHLGLIDWNSTRREVNRVAERISIRFPLNIPVEELSVADQWLISIGRALIRKARLISMDEPTASLSEKEAEILFRLIRELSNDGIGILYVSHRLDEILDLCHTITVFKDGQKVDTVQRSDATKERLVVSIVGGQISKTNISKSRNVEQPIVLSVSGLARGKAVKDVSFALHRGEVLGLGGLVGSGRTELVRMIFGADIPERGTMTLEGEPFLPKGPAEAVERGVVLVPEERRSEGLILSKSVMFNINLPTLNPLRMVNWLPLLSPKKERTSAKDIVQKLGVKTPAVNTPVSELSGGNQQKVVIGKWLSRDPKILILDEPSRGVDVGARSEIHRIIRQMAASGTSCIVISSEVEELPDFCDRVLVLVEGHISGELTGDAITKEAILHLSYAHQG